MPFGRTASGFTQALCRALARACDLDPPALHLRPQLQRQRVVEGQHPRRRAPALRSGRSGRQAGKGKNRASHARRGSPLAFGSVGSRARVRGIRGPAVSRIPRPRGTCGLQMPRIGERAGLCISACKCSAFGVEIVSSTASGCVQSNLRAAEKLSARTDGVLRGLKTGMSDYIGHFFFQYSARKRESKISY